MGKHIGSLEQLLMFAVARLADKAHGAALRAELSRATGRAVSPGAIYTTMERLERQGYVVSHLADERPLGSGRRRRFYRLQPDGARALAESYRSLESLAEGVIPVLNRIARQLNPEPAP